MWIVRWILLALLLIGVVIFAGENAGEVTSIRFLGQEFEVRLLLVIFESFIAGLVVWFLVSILRILQYRSQNRAYREENARLRAELASLKGASSAAPRSDD